MKLVADRQALLAAFQSVGGVVASTMARPIYQNVKVEARKDGVYLSATDLEVGLRIKAQKVTVEKEGAVLAPADRISSLLRTTLDETVTLEGDESAVTLRSVDGRIRVVSENPADFADIPELSGDAVVEVDPDVLRYMVERTSFAAAEEKGRYALNGVLLLIEKDGTIEMVGADGARLADVKKKASNPKKKAVDCIVMRKGIEQAVRLGALSDSPLRMQVTDKQFLAENDAGRVACQLVEGQFPNYREVVPRDCAVKIELPTKPLLNALRRAALITSEQTRAVDFGFSGGLLTLTSQSPDIGEAEVKIAVEYSGEDVQIAFNPKYIEDMLTVVERETVKMEFTDRRSPCVFRSGVDYLYVVSPVVREEGER
jgi:DNA polymerase-3 subunit beta